MPIEKVKREGMTTEEQDPLVSSLAEARDRCCDELGLIPVADIRDVAKGAGCRRCPVRVECCRLFDECKVDINRSMSLMEYRKLSQKFYLLQQKRNRILALRGVEILASHEPA